MLDLSFVNQFMYENFERVTVSADGTHFHARCPLCGDSKKSLAKKRFHLDWTPARCVWQCWNCGRSGNFLQIFAKLNHISTGDAYKQLYKFDHDKFVSSLGKQNGNGGDTKLTRSENTFNEILDDCMPYDPDSRLSMLSHDALRKFRIERKVPDDYRLYYAYKGKYRGRIILPILDSNDNIIYFQARRLPGSDMSPKYKNPASEKSLIIHNENKFDETKYIIVTEGLLDALSVGDQGTPCLGKEISEEFLDEIYERGIGVIIAFDNDKDGMKSLKKFMLGYGKKEQNKYSKRVRYFLMPERFLQYKDINNVSVSEKISDVYSFIVENSYDYMQTTLKLNLEER